MVDIIDHLAKQLEHEKSAHRRTEARLDETKAKLSKVEHRLEELLIKKAERKEKKTGFGTSLLPKVLRKLTENRPDINGARELLLEAAFEGNFIALVECLARGVRVEDLHIYALKILSGGADSCDDGGFVDYELGNLYLKRGKGMDLERAEACFRKAAQNGLVVAMTCVGECQRLSSSCRKNEMKDGISDDSSPLFWYQMALSKGDAIAATKIGIFYEKGSERFKISTDLCKATQFYQEAMTKGCPHALKRITSLNRELLFAGDIGRMESLLSKGLSPNVEGYMTLSEVFDLTLVILMNNNGPERGFIPQRKRKYMQNLGETALKSFRFVLEEKKTAENDLSDDWVWTVPQPQATVLVDPVSMSSLSFEERRLIESSSEVSKTQYEEHFPRDIHGIDSGRKFPNISENEEGVQEEGKIRKSTRNIPEGPFFEKLIRVTPLLKAALSSDIPLMKYLLCEHRAEPHRLYYGYSMLQLLILLQGSVAPGVITCMVEAKADVDQIGDSRGFESDERNLRHYAPVMLAAAGGSLKTVSALLSHGASLYTSYPCVPGMGEISSPSAEQRKDQKEGKSFVQEMQICGGQMNLLNMVVKGKELAKRLVFEYPVYSAPMEGKRESLCDIPLFYERNPWELIFEGPIRFRVLNNALQRDLGHLHMLFGDVNEAIWNGNEEFDPRHQLNSLRNTSSSDTVVRESDSVALDDEKREYFLYYRFEYPFLRGFRTMDDYETLVRTNNLMKGRGSTTLFLFTFTEFAPGEHVQLRERLRGKHVMLQNGMYLERERLLADASFPTNVFTR